MKELNLDQLNTIENAVIKIARATDEDPIDVLSMLKPAIYNKDYSILVDRIIYDN